MYSLLNNSQKHSDISASHVVSSNQSTALSASSSLQSNFSPSSHTTELGGEQTDADVHSFLCKLTPLESSKLYYGIGSVPSQIHLNIAEDTPVAPAAIKHSSTISYKRPLSYDTPNQNDIDAANNSDSDDEFIRSICRQNNASSSTSYCSQSQTLKSCAIGTTLDPIDSYNPMSATASTAPKQQQLDFSTKQLPRIREPLSEVAKTRAALLRKARNCNQTLKTPLPQQNNNELHYNANKIKSGARPAAHLLYSIFCAKRSNFLQIQDSILNNTHPICALVAPFPAANKIMYSTKYVTTEAFIDRYGHMPADLRSARYLRRNQDPIKLGLRMRFASIFPHPVDGYFSNPIILINSLADVDPSKTLNNKENLIYEMGIPKVSDELTRGMHIEEAVQKLELLFRQHPETVSDGAISMLYNLAKISHGLQKCFMGKSIYGDLGMYIIANSRDPMSNKTTATIAHFSGVALNFLLGIVQLTQSKGGRVMRVVRTERVINEVELHYTSLVAEAFVPSLMGCFTLNEPAKVRT